MWGVAVPEQRLVAPSIFRTDAGGGGRVGGEEGDPLDTACFPNVCAPLSNEAQIENGSRLLSGNQGDGTQGPVRNSAGCNFPLLSTWSPPSGIAAPQWAHSSLPPPGLLENWEVRNDD